MSRHRRAGRGRLPRVLFVALLLPILLIGMVTHYIGALLGRVPGFVPEDEHPPGDEAPPG